MYLPIYPLKKRIVGHTFRPASKAWNITGPTPTGDEVCHKILPAVFRHPQSFAGYRVRMLFLSVYEGGKKDFSMNDL